MRRFTERRPRAGFVMTLVHRRILPSFSHLRAHLVRQSWRLAAPLGGLAGADVPLWPDHRGAAGDLAHGRWGRARRMVAPHHSVPGASLGLCHGGRRNFGDHRDLGRFGHCDRHPGFDVARCWRSTGRAVGGPRRSAGRPCTRGAGISRLRPARATRDNVATGRRSVTRPRYLDLAPSGPVSATDPLARVCGHWRTGWNFDVSSGRCRRWPEGVCLRPGASWVGDLPSTMPSRRWPASRASECSERAFALRRDRRRGRITLGG
jgi:hypothetical protein